MKLVILGNGFDLHHGYPTSFGDFRSFLQNSSKKEDIGLINKVDRLLGLKENERTTKFLWNNFETIVGKLMGNQQYLRHEIENIPATLEEFSQKFYSYLNEVTSERKHKNNLNLEKEFEEAAAMISFNYTNLYESYFNYFNQDDVFHIHGTLSDDNLPIIGFYYEGNFGDTRSTDYNLKFGGKIFHKPALSMKQNNISFETRIAKFTSELEHVISEIVVIGYSFGESDEHIYKLLNKLLLRQICDPNVPKEKAASIPTIKFKIYNYNTEESNGIKEKVKNKFLRLNRKSSINVTGVGFAPLIKDLIEFRLNEY